MPFNVKHHARTDINQDSQAENILKDKEHCRDCMTKITVCTTE